MVALETNNCITKTQKLIDSKLKGETLRFEN